MKGAIMVIPKETMSKMQTLSQEQMSAVISFVDQLSSNKANDVLNDLCTDGCKNPMSDEEVATFVADVRKKRYAAGD